MDTDRFEISGEYIELVKLLKVTGVCGTGGEAKIAIEEGMVAVDGVIELRKRRKLYPAQLVSIEKIVIEVVKGKK